MTPATPATAKHGKNAFFFVIVAVVLNMLAFGMIMPIMPALMFDLTGLPAEESVAINGWLSATFAVANFMAMPVLGGLSDRYGRRPVLLVSIAMLGVDMLIMALAPTLAILFVGRFLGGLFSATYSVANAYIADVTEPDERGRAFGMMGAAFGIGFIMGPVFGGLLGDIHTRLPFLVAAGICGINFLYGFFVLPESLPKESRRKFELSRANPFGTLVHFSKLPKVMWFLVVIFLYQIAHTVFPATWNFHGEIRYGWGELEIGLSMAAWGFVAAIGQGFLTGPIIKKLGPMGAVMFGLMINIIVMVGFAFSTEGWMTYAVTFALGMFAGIVSPAINTITSTLTPRNAQGELQGAQASIMAFTLIFSPVLLTQTLKHFSTPETAPILFPGAAFMLAGIIIALAIIPFLIGVRINRRALAEAERLKAEAAAAAPAE